MADGPLETAFVFFGLICALALVLLLVTGEKGGAMHGRPPKPPVKPKPPKECSDDRIVAVLRDILAELRKLREAIGALSEVAEQSRLDALTERLNASTAALKVATTMKEGD